MANEEMNTPEIIQETVANEQATTETTAAENAGTKKKSRKEKWSLADSR